eukprot:Clim_evm1s193 gene=Clim_evmTU1s193
MVAQAATIPSVRGVFKYQSSKVPRSLLSTGKVFLNRQVNGSDDLPVGTDPTDTEYDVHNGRSLGLNLDDNGFQLVEHKYNHIDYYSEDQIVNRYYPEVAEYIKQKLGAKKVYVFDHNVRTARTQSWMNQEGEDQPAEGKIVGSKFNVQSPAVVVHNDYTLTAAKERVRQLAEPPRKNDSWGVNTNQEPLISPEELPELLNGRWAIVNLWRNIAEEPVNDMPLAMCDAQTIDMDQLITFEIRYDDRVGENYFAVPRDQNKWYYFPKMVKDEAILLKVWDSEGKDVRALNDKAEVDADKAKENGGVSASFSFHSAFKDPSANPNGPSRESIELRTVVFY